MLGFICDRRRIDSAREAYTDRKRLSIDCRFGLGDFIGFRTDVKFADSEVRTIRKGSGTTEFSAKACNCSLADYLKGFGCLFCFEDKL